MVRIKKLRQLLLSFVAVLSLVIGPLGLASASSVSAASELKGLKPAPTAPAPNRKDAPKAVHNGATANGAVTPAINGWTVSLSASSTYLWPTQYSTLTATANADVGPTPYYLSIYDFTAASYVAICASGTTCSASVTQPNAATHTYQAYVSSYPSGNPPANVQASSSYVSVTWRSVTVTLQASPTTVGIGGTSTLTSTTSADVGPSPFYTEIFDATTGTRIGVCGFGTSCTASTSQSVATTHKFIAYVSNYSTAFPPTGTQATSNNSYVTWANTGYTVSLSASTGYGNTTLTATSNVDVGPTPYFIEIFNNKTGARVAVCGSGTTCSVNTSLSFGENDFVAFISSYDTAVPPLNAQASSNVVFAYYFPIP